MHCLSCTWIRITILNPNPLGTTLLLSLFPTTPCKPPAPREMGSHEHQAFLPHSETLHPLYWRNFVVFRRGGKWPNAKRYRTDERIFKGGLLFLSISEYSFRLQASALYWINFSSFVEDIKIYTYLHIFKDCS